MFAIKAKARALLEELMIQKATQKMIKDFKHEHKVWEQEEYARTVVAYRHKIRSQDEYSRAIASNSQNLPKLDEPRRYKEGVLKILKNLKPLLNKMKNFDEAVNITMQAAFALFKFEMPDPLKEASANPWCGPKSLCFFLLEESARAFTEQLFNLAPKNYRIECDEKWSWTYDKSRFFDSTTLSYVTREECYLSKKWHVGLGHGARQPLGSIRLYRVETRY